MKRPTVATLRGRVTLVAGLGITVAIVAGVVLLYLLLLRTVEQTITAQLKTYAVQVEQTGQSGRWPDPLPPSAIDSAAQAQVLDDHGDVLAATRTLTGLPAIYTLPDGSSLPIRQKAADEAMPTEVKVVAIPATVAGRQVFVIAATPTTLLHQFNAAFAPRLLFGVPLVLALACAAVWLIVGRALRPVRRITDVVTAITSSDLSRRVPQPPTADEVGLLARTMNDMLGRLEGSAKRQRRFVADASHELRTPLAAIRTGLEVALAHPDTAPWPQIAQRTIEQSGRLEDLVEQLLALARSDDAHRESSREQVDLEWVLSTVAANQPPGGPRPQVRIRTAAVVDGHPHDLQRLFANLVDNASRYANHRVMVTLSADADTAIVEVDDDGPGIPEPDRERVFDRFVRLDPSRGRTSGSSGLGMAIAREITLAHAGRISVTGSSSGGARVIVHLPRRTPGHPAGQRPAPAERTENTGLSMPGGTAEPGSGRANRKP